MTIAQARVGLQDPHDATDSADTLALFEALFDALVRRDVHGRYQPALAESWSVSHDARQWRFRLRPGLRFHDGTPLDSAAMCFSIERMMRPDIGATLGAPAVWAQYLGGATVDTPDPLTVAVTTVEPTADLLDVLVSGYALPPHAADTPAFAERPIGTGAYRVESVTSGGIWMRVNPDWWGGMPANPALAWRPIPDPAERAAALVAGDVEAATRLRPGAVRTAMARRCTIAEHIDPTAIIYLLNAASGPFADPRVRRAVNLAVDRRSLIETVLAGAGRPLAGFVSPVHVGADASSGEICDPDEARRLLAAAGHGDGLAIGIDCPTRLPDEAEALTAAVAGQLATVGIAATVHRVDDRTAYAERVRDKRIHDMCLFDSSPMSTFRVLHEKIDSRTRGSWWQGYRNPGVEAILDRSRTTVDRVAREALHRRSFRLLQEDPAWLTLYTHLHEAGLTGDHPDWRIRADGILDVAALPRLAGAA